MENVPATTTASAATGVRTSVRSSYIPSLDGLRALAVLAVIVGHAGLTQVRWVPRGISDNGSAAVTMFFVLSGFLITHLLVQETDETGRMDLRRFYLRRAFRIFPAFYVFLAAAVIAGALHLYPNPPGVASVIAAATYTINYLPNLSDWVLGHFWSLCIEEQFYLLWPVCLVLLPRRRAVWVCIAVVFLSPLLRVSTFLADRDTLTSLNRMLPTHADGLMMGSFLALALSLEGPACKRILRVLRHPLVAGLCALYLFFISVSYADWFRQSFGYMLDAVCCGSVMFYLVGAAETPVGRLLNTRWIRHIGVVSYSLYLWQQLLTGPNTRCPPWNLLVLMACAEASYWLVEKPALRLRSRLFGARTASDKFEGASFLRRMRAI